MKLNICISLKIKELYSDKKVYRSQEWFCLVESFGAEKREASAKLKTSPLPMEIRSPSPEHKRKETPVKRLSSIRKNI